jgi:hypothetical protein
MRVAVTLAALVGVCRGGCTIKTSTCYADTGQGASRLLGPGDSPDEALTREWCAQQVRPLPSSETQHSASTP